MSDLGTPQYVKLEEELAFLALPEQIKSRATCLRKMSSSSRSANAQNNDPHKDELDRLLDRLKQEASSSREESPPEDGTVDTEAELAKIREQRTQPSSTTMSAPTSPSEDPFAELKAQRQQAQPTASGDELDSKLDQIRAKKNQGAAKDSNSDNLFARLKNELQASRQSPASRDGLEDAIAEIEEQWSQKETPSPQDNSLAQLKSQLQQQRQQQQPSPLGENTNQFLEQLRTEQAAKIQQEQAATQVDRHQNLQEIQQAERRRQERRKRLERMARQWLDNLDPLSEEGLWFEEFAYAYPSKLEAAIDYLEALSEVK